MVFVDVNITLSDTVFTLDRNIRGENTWKIQTDRMTHNHSTLQHCELTRREEATLDSEHKHKHCFTF